MDFLSKILPRTGVYVLAEFRNGLKNAPLHHFYSTVEELTLGAIKYDATGVNVFHACSTYLTDSNRKQDNAGWMRSIWLDIDVGKANDAKSYSTRKEALAELLGMCEKLGLPAPMIVKSGMGLHVYWVLDADITKDEWTPIVGAFSNALNSVGFKHDPSRTKDASSVLRPVGTHWYKNDATKDVELIHNAPEYPVEIFNAIIGQYGELKKPKAASMFEMTNDLGAPPEYPPSSAYQIITNCAAIAEVAETKGNVAEPLWRAMIGVVKHTTEGEALCHEWSKGDSRYSHAEAQKKIDGWIKPPTSCANFSELSDKCKSCKHMGKITSPISLGYVVEEPKPIEVPAIEVVEGKREYTMPKGYEWKNGVMNKAVLIEDNVWHPTPFATQKFIITMRVRTADGIMMARCIREVYDGVWREFEFDLSLLPQRQNLTAMFAGHEIYTLGKKGPEMLADYVRDYLEKLRYEKVETAIYDSYGWQEAKTRFVIGSTAITKEGDITVDVAKDIANVTSKLDTVSGSLEGWVSGVDEMYNHEGAEAAQFIILTAFASPLIGIADMNGWHGIPIGITGATGNGKTKVCNVATSIFGPASSLQFQSTSDRGMTANARTQVMASLKNLPIIFDEITGIPPADLADLFYGASAGKPKIRLDQRGKFSNLSKLAWDMFIYITCQSPMEQVLSGVRREVIEATTLRCFSINVDTDEGWKFPKDVEAVETFINSQYGLVGREYMQYVIEHRAEIHKNINKFIMKYAPDTITEENERYYRMAIATVLFAGQIAKSLGFIKFDLEKVKKWADKQIGVLRNKRVDAVFTAEEYLSSFLGSLIGKTIVTDHFGEGRREQEHPQLEIRGAPVARRSVDKAKPRLVVTRKALTDWGKETNVDIGWLITELKRTGHIMENPKVGAPTCLTGKMARIGSGTPIQLPSVYVLEFDVHKLSGSGAVSPAEITDFDEAAAVRKFKQK